ncbi:MAG: DoxX family protein [Gemmatimonadota bacterium]
MGPRASASRAGGERRAPSRGDPGARQQELGAAALLVLGLWDQLAALAIIGVMLGAIGKKALVWKTGFWGEGSTGWYYDALYLICALVILTTGGGAIGID